MILRQELHFVHDQKHTATVVRAGSWASLNRLSPAVEVL